MTRCPGLYCGLIDNGTTCGACPRGFRSSNSIPGLRNQGSSSVCVECTDLLTFHDWLYLCFMTILLLLVQWYIIDCSIKRRTLTKDVLLMHSSAAIEVILASLTLLVTLSSDNNNYFLPWNQIKSCNVQQLSDWYTVFWNPNPNYKETLRCSQEAVYPLYSMVFMFFGLDLLFLLLIRPFMVRKVSDKNAGKTIYLTMYAIPALSLLHALLGGIFYYLFPFMTIIGSLLSLAVHLSCRLDQRMSSLFWNSVKDGRNLTILLGHWSLHTFGIVSLTRLKDDPVRDLLLIVTLIPIPTVFYFVTSRFTDPSKLQVLEHQH